MTWGIWKCLSFAYGEVREWTIRHAWRACVPQGTVGSNPTLSVFPLWVLDAPVVTCEHHVTVDAAVEWMVVSSDS